MLSLLVFLTFAHPSPVIAMHGARTEIVFTEPFTITAKLTRQQAYQATRTRLAASDDGGTIYLDGGPSVYDVAGTSERGDCQWYGPRLDGTDVRVCAGSVVAVRLGSDERQATR